MERDLEEQLRLDTGRLAGRLRGQHAVQRGRLDVLEHEHPPALVARQIQRAHDAAVLDAPHDAVLALEAGHVLRQRMSAAQRLEDHRALALLGASAVDRREIAVVDLAEVPVAGYRDHPYLFVKIE